MGNMSYCRFRNTLSDLRACLENMDEKIEDPEEKLAKERLIKVCKQVANDYFD